MKFNACPQHQALVDQWIDHEITPNIKTWGTLPEIPVRPLVKSLSDNALLLCGWPSPFGDGDIRKQLYLHYALANQPLGSIGLSLVSHLDIGARGLLEKGEPDLKSQWLPGALKGEHIFALAMTEPNAGSDLQSIEFHAKQQGDQWCLNGIKRGITNLPCADVAIVLARTRADRTPFSYTLFLVPLKISGIQKEQPLPSLGYAGCLGGFEASDAYIPEDHILGMPGTGLMQLMQHLQTERLFVSVRMRGLADYLFSRLPKKSQETMSATIHAFHALFDICVENYINNCFTQKESATLKFLGSQLLQTLTAEAFHTQGQADFFDQQWLERCNNDALGLGLAGGSREIMLSIIGNEL